MCRYNKRFLKAIREALGLTQREMSNMLGIPRGCLIGYENGRFRANEFFYERMIELYGIDLNQPEDLHKIVFTDGSKISRLAFTYLSQLEIREEAEK
jgi:transcriptional regulator with XRE-family HTH domain